MTETEHELLEHARKIAQFNELAIVEETISIVSKSPVVIVMDAVPTAANRGIDEHRILLCTTRGISEKLLHVMVVPWSAAAGLKLWLDTHNYRRET